MSASDRAREGEGEGIARAWVAHLRAGGTSTWREARQDGLSAQGAGGPGAVHATIADPAGDPLPGAAQLELVRRLNEECRRQGTFSDTARRALVDLALSRGAPGRGLADHPLDTGPGQSGETGSDEATGARPATGAGPAIGAPPVDPSAVPAGELARGGAGLLVEILLRQAALPSSAARTTPGGPDDRGTPGAQGGRAPRRPPTGRRPWGRRFQLAGAPATVDRARAELAAAGHHGGARPRRVVLLAPPLERGLGEVWAARVQAGAPVSWRDFAARWSRRDDLPPSADLAALAATWADLVGPGRVHVLFSPDTAGVAEILRLRRASSRAQRAVPGARASAARPSGALTPAGVQALARVNQVLTIRVPAEQRDLLRAQVRAALPPRGAGEGASAPALPGDRGWVLERAATTLEALRAGGYPVHGDPGSLSQLLTGRDRARGGDVVDAMVTALVTVVGAQPANEGG